MEPFKTYLPWKLKRQTGGKGPQWAGWMQGPPSLAFAHPFLSHVLAEKDALARGRRRAVSLCLCLNPLAKQMRPLHGPSSSPITHLCTYAFPLGGSPSHLCPWTLGTPLLYIVWGSKRSPPKLSFVCSRFNQQYKKSKICHKLLS